MAFKKFQSLGQTEAETLARVSEPPPPDLVPVLGDKPGPLRCPHCYGRGVSAVKKLFTGPISKRRCSKCGGHWRLSKWVFALILLVAVAALGLLLGIWLSRWMEPSPESIWVVAIPAYVFMMLGVIYWVPVRKC